MGGERAIERECIGVEIKPDAKGSAVRPKVVTLCGSTRFKSEFLETAKSETLEGRIVLMPNVFGHSGDLHPEDFVSGKTKVSLDELHWHKIDLSDEILVLNVGGYVGDSTRKEIDYALRTGKPVRYIASTKGES